MQPPSTRPGDPKTTGLNRPARLARELESLQVLIDSMGREADVVPLLTRLLDLACELIGADHGAIGLVDRARNVVRTAAVRNMPPNELGAEMGPGVGLSGQVLATGATVYARRYGDLANPTQPALVEHVVIGVPIRWGNDLIGVFGLGRRSNPPVCCAGRDGHSSPRGTSTRWRNSRGTRPSPSTTRGATRSSVVGRTASL
jgi:GAF domain-containing protein